MFEPKVCHDKVLGVQTYVKCLAGKGTKLIQCSAPKGLGEDLLRVRRRLGGKEDLNLRNVCVEAEDNASSSIISARMESIRVPIGRENLPGVLINFECLIGMSVGAILGWKPVC